MLKTLRKVGCKAFWELIHNTTVVKKLLHHLHETTVFCPSDDVIRKLPDSTKSKLSRDPAYLEAVLKYHIVGRRHTTKSFGEYEEMETSYVNRKTGDNIRLIVTNYGGVSGPC